MTHFRFSFFAIASAEIRTEAAGLAVGLRQLRKVSNKTIRKALLLTYMPR